MSYTYTCPKCSKTIEFSSKRPYEKNVAQGCCCRCLTIGEHKCVRCDTVIRYVSPQSYAEAREKSDCSKCKRIPDSSLEDFKKGIFTKHCPKCDAVQTYRTKFQLLAAIRLGHICHSCASTEMIPIVRLKSRRTRMKRTPEQRAEISEKMSQAHKARFALLSSEEQEAMRQRGRDSLKKLHDNMTPEEKEKWHRKLKMAFVKHRGDNHWMKKPEVLQKVKDSCVKYRGDNHWIHRVKKSVGRKNK